MTAYDNEVAEEYLRLAEDTAAKNRIRVLVLGPNTHRTSIGARLRKYIASKCNSPRIPIFAERQSLIEAFRKVIGEHGDLCSYEMHLARNLADAIIIIPCSTGSLVELGLFALEEDIHGKVLVLLSDQYPPANSPTFINLGPRVSYGLRSATVKDVDYKDKEAVWTIVDDFLSRRSAVLFAKKRLGVG